jgi:hypothetical protein
MIRDSRFMISKTDQRSRIMTSQSRIKNQESRIKNGFARSDSASSGKCPVSEHGSDGWNRGGHAEREETPSERAPPRRTDLFGEQQPGPESEGAARRRDERQFWNRKDKISHQGILLVGRRTDR